jgi:hydroxyacylglutathione hydrolase
MLFLRLYENEIAQASYLIGCQQTGEAIIVDPSRDVARYIRAAEDERVRITHVIETHIHADFLSGSRDLARRADAKLLLSGEGRGEWQYGFLAEATAVRDGDRFDVGRVRLDVLHTPGHTPEHIALLVTDSLTASEPMGVLSGDAVFVGDVGRPDLLVKTRRANGSARESASPDDSLAEMAAAARELFRTVQRFRALPDHLQLWPGHGAGSACGKSLGAVPQSTIGYEKRFNWAFGIDDEASFVTAVLEGQPEPPRYFARMKRLNRDGPPPVGARPSPSALAPESFPVLQRGGVVVIDTRSPKTFAAGHLPGTLNVPLDASFVTRAGSLLPDDAIVALLVEGGARNAERAVRALALIGVDEIHGVLDEGALEWQSKNGGLATIEQISPRDAAAGGGAQIIDVRNASEWAEGHVPGALHMPLPELADRMAELPEGPLVLHCQGGSRSVIATSLLLAAGRTDVANMEGGYTAWRREGLPTSTATTDANTPAKAGAR